MPLHKLTLNRPFSRTTRVSRYQKGKTNLEFTEARDSASCCPTNSIKALKAKLTHKYLKSQSHQFTLNWLNEVYTTFLLPSGCARWQWTNVLNMSTAWEGRVLAGRSLMGSTNFIHDSRTLSNASKYTDSSECSWIQYHIKCLHLRKY